MSSISVQSYVYPNLVSGKPHWKGDPTGDINTLEDKDDPNLWSEIRYFKYKILVFMRENQ